MEVRRRKLEVTTQFNTVTTHRKELSTSPVPMVSGGMARAGTWHETAPDQSLSGAGSTLCRKACLPTVPDLLAVQLLLFPEVFHLLCFLPKGLRQLDVTLSHIVYLCKEKINSIFIYIFLKRLFRKST